MNKIKVVKDRNYTTISNVILRDKQLSLKAKGLLITVMGLPDNWDFTIQGISRVLKEGKESISSAIQELMDGGYCSRQNHRDNDGRYVGYDYTFYESPTPATDEPTTENPVQVNTQQLSKHPINDLKNKENSKAVGKSSQIQEVYEFWKTTMALNGSTKLTTEREAKIKARLKDYSIERIKSAIIGCSLSPYHQGKNDTGTKYLDIELICRTGSKLEAFEAIANTQQKPTMSDEEAQARADFLISQELNNGR